MGTFTSIRLGPATNSSSSHSVIYHTAPERKPTHYGLPYDYDEYGFSEAPYSLQTKKEKMTFLTHSSAAFVKWMTDNLEYVRMVINDPWFTIDDIPQCNGESSTGLYANLLQVSNHELAFAFFMDDLVAIHGGRDDGSFMGEFLDLEVAGYFTADSYSMRWTCDLEKRALVAHHPGTGIKFRWTDTIDYTKSSVPELVDVKITDFCDYGCKFCYMGSTEEGVHAPLSRIIEIADKFKELGVYEVALGGGETTSHPDFAKILNVFADRGISPNFTTYGTNWASNPVIVETIIDIMSNKRMCVGIGVSVHTVRDLGKLETIRNLFSETLKTHGLKTYHRPNLIAQTVVGVTPYSETQKIIEASLGSNISLLALGYKTTGRGASFKEKKTADVSGLLDSVSSYFKNSWGPTEFYERKTTFSVDTSFIDQHRSELVAAGIPECLYASPEGAFSMYIDAVEGIMGPSSYSPERNQKLDLENLKEKFGEY